MRAMSLRSELREAVRLRSHGHCEWPGPCSEWGAELAHLHSTGAGGRPSADTLSNVAWLCWTHARYSDGEAPHGKAAYEKAMRALLGDDWGMAVAWNRAETLRRHIENR